MAPTRAPSNRNAAHDHVGILRTIMLEKVRIIVGIRNPAKLSKLLQRFGVARCVQKLDRARAVAWFQECQSSAS